MSQPSNLGRSESEDVVLVQCAYCHKTHAAKRDEEECSPGAWTVDATGQRWEDLVAVGHKNPLEDR